MTSDDNQAVPKQPPTHRGRDIRARIVSTAAQLMYERGIAATSVDRVLSESATGKSQFYHYFSGKDELVSEVLRHQLERILADEDRLRLESWADAEAWLAAAVAGQQARHFRGCPLGSIAGEAAEQSGRLRTAASQAFAQWETALAQKLGVMRARGLLHETVDVQSLAETLIAILQGGYLLSSIRRDIGPMRHASEAARRELEILAPNGGPARKGSTAVDTPG